MGWSVWQGFAVDSSGNIIASPTVTVTRASDGAVVTLASDVDGTGKTNPFTGEVSGLVRFYAQAGRYNVTVSDGTTSTTFADVLLGTAAGCDTGTGAGNVPTVAQGLTLYEPRKLNNYSATTFPTATDDSDDGYTAGSLWVDTSACPAETFLCIDPTAGAALWVSVNLTIGDLGTMALQDANAVAITGGTISGLDTPLATADGGTGANTPAGARTALGLGTAATADVGDFATAAQGAKADSAIQPGGNVSSLANDAGYITGLATPVSLSASATVDATYDGRPVNVTGTSGDVVLTLPQVSTYNARAGFWGDVFRNTSDNVTFQAEGSDVIKALIDGTEVDATAVRISGINGWASYMKISNGVWSVVGQIEDVSP